jgi:hypothetical protein
VSNPEVSVNTQYRRQQIPWIVVTLGQRVCLKPLNGKWDQDWRADLLADHDPQVFDSELGEWLSAQLMASDHQG